MQALHNAAQAPQILNVDDRDMAAKHL